MERMTYTDNQELKPWVHSTDAIKRLAAYEDTNLKPEDIKRVFNEEAVLKLAAQVLGTTPDRLRELVKLPVNLGQKVWFPLKDMPCFYPDTNGWYLSEETIVAIATNGFGTEKIDYESGAEVYFIPFEDIGKTVFLTREEAKAALEGENHETD